MEKKQVFKSIGQWLRSRVCDHLWMSSHQSDKDVCIKCETKSPKVRVGSFS